MIESPASWGEVRFGELNRFFSRTLDPATSPDEAFELYSVPSFPSGMPESQLGSAIGSNKQIVEPADVLVCKINPRINRVWQVGPKQNLRQIASSEWIVMRAPEIDPRFLRYFFSSPEFRELICQDVTGVGGSLTRAQPKRVATFKIPIAPLGEQKRIADKLDAILARVDTCREHLDRVPVILKRFRQSVLAAATSGKLTEEWREEHGTIGSGSEVVRQDAVRKQEFLSRDPSLVKKKSTLESHIDLEHVFEIPGQWAFSTWGVVSEWITYGFTRPMPHADEGFLLLTARDVQNFAVQFQGAEYTTHIAFASLSEKDRPKAGDLLLTKDGTIGRAALVRTDAPFCINQSVAVCWLRSTTMNKNYLELVANADFTQQFIREKAKGMAIQHLSITDFAQCPLPVPPLPEQHEIVRCVESLFAYADRIEARYTTACAKVERLTPALLGKAFRGELVPQEPTDEPASILLERIRQEKAREAAQPKVKDKRKDKKMKHRQEEQKDILAVLRKSGKALTPEKVFSAAGFDEASVDSFYKQLREAIASKQVREIRKGKTIRLEVIVR